MGRTLALGPATQRAAAQLPASRHQARLPALAAAKARPAAARLAARCPAARCAHRRALLVRTEAAADEAEVVAAPPVDGEDAAVFELERQSPRSWAIFSVLLAVVGAALYEVWIAPAGQGLGLGSDFMTAIEALTGGSSEATILAILGVFAVVHSGLAYLRPYGERAIGARAYRVVFALASLPLAVCAVVYFINHRYDGVQLWNLRGVPGIHSLVWGLSFVSFYFLYPSTFNLLEVAAVDEPKLHLWETGIMRITRHPQAWGQLMWCAAHSLWIGSSFMVATSLGLMAHHAFGCWHGDLRLRDKYGEAAQLVISRTSVLPFAAILDGRQQLPADYYKEFLRGPYLVLIPFCVGAYLCHPLMQLAAHKVGW